MTDQMNQRAERMAKLFTLKAIQNIINGSERKLIEAEECPMSHTENVRKFITSQIEKITIARFAYNLRSQLGGQ